MKRAVYLPAFGGLLVIALSIVPADTAPPEGPNAVSIAGVTVVEHNRKAGIPVILSIDKAGGSMLDVDTSSTSGVYNLSTSGIDPETPGLWLRSDPNSGWVCQPFFAYLGSARDGVRRAKKDLDCLNTHKPAFSREEAASIIRDLQGTAAIEVRAGGRTEEEAKKRLADTAAQILAKVPGVEPGSSEARQVIQQSLSQIDRHAAPKPFLDEKDLMDLTNRPEFRNRGHNESNLYYRRYLTHPDEAPIDMLQKQFNQSLQKKIEKSQIGLEANSYKLYVLGREPRVEVHYVPEKEPRVEADAQMQLSVRKGVRVPQEIFIRWLNMNPEARTYLIYDKLIEEELVSEDELKKIKVLREQLTPVVQLEVPASPKSHGESQ